MYVLRGMSALAYYRTPCQLVQSSIDPRVLLDGGEETKGLYDTLTRGRSNESRATQMMRVRACSDLMGVPLPIQVGMEVPASMRSNGLVLPRRIPKHQNHHDLVSIGGDLFVPTVPQLLLELSRGRSVVELALLMMEACGLFTVFHETPQASHALRVLREHERAENMALGACVESRPWCNAYYDEGGNVLTYLDELGEVMPWRQAVESSGARSNLWARPPLSTREELIAHYEECLSRGVPNSKKALTAAELVLDGAASPIEAKFALLQFAPVARGGDGWPRPWLNRRVGFIPELRDLAGCSWCSCDEMWLDPKADIELNGRAFHADSRGFTLESGRRAALEAMGFRVLEINQNQMNDYDVFETLVRSFSDALGFQEGARTPCYCARRRKLYQEVMGFRY